VGPRNGVLDTAAVERRLYRNKPTGRGGESIWEKKGLWATFLYQGLSDTAGCAGSLSKFPAIKARYNPEVGDRKRLATFTGASKRMIADGGRKPNT